MMHVCVFLEEFSSNQVFLGDTGADKGQAEVLGDDSAASRRMGYSQPCRSQVSSLHLYFN